MNTWSDFLTYVKQNNGIAFFDDHHRAGTLKYLYVLSENEGLIGGYYGAEEYDVINQNHLLEKKSFDSFPFHATLKLDQFKDKSIDVPVTNVMITFHKVTDPDRPPMDTTWSVMTDGRIKIEFVSDKVPVEYRREGFKMVPTEMTRTSFWTSNPFPFLFATEKKRLADILQIKLQYVDHT